MTVDVTSLLYATARWLCYLAVFLVVGAAVMRWVVLPRAGRAAGTDPAGLQARTVTVARLAAVLLAVSLFLRLFFQARSLIDPEEPLTLDLFPLLLATAWGRGWLAQATAAIATLAGWRLLARDRPAGTVLAVAGAAGLVLAMPLTGHATGLPAAGRIGYPLTAVHLAGAAAWLGTLGMVWLVRLRREPVAEPLPLGALIAGFSPVALVSGLAAIGAGVVIAWRYVGTFDALTSTGYGQTLVVKVSLLAVVAATGLWNWRVALPRLLRGDPHGIRRTARIELLVALAVLAVTAWLVALGAPGEHD